MQEKFQEFLKNSPEMKILQSEEEKEKEKNKLNEVLDTKIESAFERMRNDNMYLWK